MSCEWTIQGRKYKVETELMKIRWKRKKKIIIIIVIQHIENQCRWMHKLIILILMVILIVNLNWLSLKMMTSMQLLLLKLLRAIQTQLTKIITITIQRKMMTSTRRTRISISNPKRIFHHLVLAWISNGDTFGICFVCFVCLKAINQIQINERKDHLIHSKVVRFMMVNGKEICVMAMENKNG